MIIKISNKHRIICLILTSLGILGYLTSLVFSLNFIIDYDFLDSISLFNRLSKNKMFNLSDYYNCGDSNKMKYLINIILSGILWFYQFNHVKISDKIFSNYREYIFLTKSIYAVFNSILNLQLFLFWQPIHSQFYNFENGLILTIYSMLFYSSLIIHLLSLSYVYDADLLGTIYINLGWTILKSVLFDKELKYPKNIKVKFSWLYRACRHPMQGSFMGLLIFSSATYSYGKLLFIVIFCIGIWIGIMIDELYMMNDDFYRKYLYLVNNRYIPDLFNCFSRKLERILNN